MMWTIPALPRPGDGSEWESRHHIAQPRINAQHGVCFLAAGQHTQACARKCSARLCPCWRMHAELCPSPAQPYLSVTCPA